MGVHGNFFLKIIEIGIFLRISESSMAIHLMSQPGADPGFPVWGGGAINPHWEGAPTSDAGTFWQKCKKNERIRSGWEGAHARNFCM